MKLNCGLIVSDFDGTLIDDNQKVPPEVCKAIKEYVKGGGVFAVITGRMLRSILPRVRELGLTGLVIAYQGSVIAEIESEKIIKTGGMEFGDVAEICRYIEELGFYINVYSNEELYTDIPKDNVYLQRYEQIVGVEATQVKGKISQFVQNNKLFCQKIASLVKEDDRMFLYNRLREKFGDRFDVTCSAKVLVEISPKEDNKGAALKYLAKHYGIPMEKTVAVGDNLNDLSMIVAAGVGCAVGNAEEELKRAADFVAVSNNDGAVAQIIKKFGFA